MGCGMLASFFRTFSGYPWLRFEQDLALFEFTNLIHSTLK